MSRIETLALALSVSMFLPALNYAGVAPLPLDHQICFKIKDGIRVRADLDLLSEQFDISENCKIIGNKRLYCTSGNKMADPPPVFEFPDFPDASDQICYRIECPIEQEDVEVVDQFGVRIVSNLRTRYLCTPAIRTDEPCEMRAACGGDCNDEVGNPGICAAQMEAEEASCQCLELDGSSCNHKCRKELRACFSSGKSDRFCDNMYNECLADCGS